MTAPFTFTARVAEDAISRVSRLFNASLDDIFAELFQNARRAGASKISVCRIAMPDLGDVIAVIGNGPGIADPENLFILGHSGWSDETQAREDAAGMGFFALAGRKVRIIAQQAGTDRSWVIDAEPDSFAGKTPITCRPGPTGHDGVTILIAGPPHEPFVAAANHAARYLPLAVMVDGVVADRHDYLEKAGQIAHWQGLRIGLYASSTTAFRNDGTINFHGVTFQAALPHVDQVFHRSYHVRIDVVDCPELKLVLPARKEIVSNAFFLKLKTQVLRIIFEQIKASGAHSLPYATWCKAKDLGVVLPPAAQMLRPFTPAIADRGNANLESPKPLGAEGLLLDSDDEPINEQNLANALSGVEDGPRLFEPNSAFAGYGWYDALPCLALTGYRIKHGDSIERLPLETTPLTNERPQRLFIEGEIGTPTDVVPWELETDYLVLGEDHCHIDEADICVTVSSVITHDDLVDHLKRALFCPSDDYEAGSYDDQEQWFTDEAEDRAITLLQSDNDANANAVIRTITRELYWLCKPKSDVTIRIIEGKVHVAGLERQEPSGQSVAVSS